MDRKTRTLEELITLQDTAIEALKQALAATQLALEVVTRARNEHGTILPMFPAPDPSVYTIPNQPWQQPQIVPTWSFGDGIAGGTAIGGTLTNTGNVQDGVKTFSFNAALVEQKALAAVTMSAQQQSFAQKMIADYKETHGMVHESIKPEGAFAGGQGCIE